MLCKEKSIETMEKSIVTKENYGNIDEHFGKINEHHGKSSKTMEDRWTVQMANFSSQIQQSTGFCSKM